MTFDPKINLRPALLLPGAWWEDMGTYYVLLRENYTWNDRLAVLRTNRLRGEVYGKHIDIEPGASVADAMRACEVHYMMGEI